MSFISQTHEPTKTAEAPAPAQEQVHWPPLGSPEETASSIDEELATVLAGLDGISVADAARTLSLLRPGSLATLHTSGIIDKKPTAGGGYEVSLTPFGEEMIRSCADKFGAGGSTLSQQDFKERLRESAANIAD